MTQKTQKIITSVLVAIGVTVGFQILILLANIYQIRYFFIASVLIWLYLWVKIAVLYDLHFRVSDSWQRAKTAHRHIENDFHRVIRTVLTALWHRIEHLRNFQTFKHYLNYLLLPGFIFWSTAAIIFVNLGQTLTQQLYAWLSSGALIVAFWYLKEIFSRKKEQVDYDVFVALSSVKIYAVTIAYGSGLIMLKRYCLEPKLFVAGIFAVTFLFIYQALFQHNYIYKKSLFMSFLASLVMAVAGYFVYTRWSFNYFTAGVFLASIYNFLWGLIHYHLDGTLNKKTFFESLLILAVVSLLVFSNTNFKETLFGAC